MLLFRNPEMKRLTLFYALFTLATVIGAFIHDGFTGVYVLAICITAGLAFFLFTGKRYNEIAGLSELLDQILGGKEMLNFVPDEEGELAILTSEIFKMTLRLREQTKQLQAEKLYLGNSIADISHQLRTPLTSMGMLIPRLGRENLTPEQRKEYALEINRLLIRMEWLIRALLKIAGLESGTVEFSREEVTVQEVISRALTPLEILIEIKNIDVRVELDSHISYIGDLPWTVEAIGNILKNCVEHLQVSGCLAITALENPIYTEILISDNGKGIESQDLPHLFERFYKGKNSRAENVGIGLALSQMIIKQQNGTIKASNIKPHGAQFEIRFYKGII